MKYFQSLPQIATTDYQGNQIILTNLLTRAYIVQSLLSNPMVFYNYDIQDGDTPEKIADKYYGDSYRYWIVLLANQIIDPQWQWPMGPSLFNDYLQDKYSDAANTANTNVLAYTQGTIQNYIKSVTTIDSVTNTQNTTIQIIDQNAYVNALSTQGMTIGNLGNGVTVTQITSVYPQYIYDYEVQQNEANRNINLVNAAYVPQFEQQFQSLMSK